MNSATTYRTGLLVGLAAAIGGFFWFKRNNQSQASDHPAPAFAGEGAALGSPVQVRDAGPVHMRDEEADWDKIDEAADESFPASDPPATY
jgi:hypothetical protein